MGNSAVSPANDHACMIQHSPIESCGLPCFTYEQRRFPFSGGHLGPSGATRPFHGRPGGCGALRFAWTNCPAPWPRSGADRVSRRSHLTNLGQDPDHFPWELQRVRHLAIAKFALGTSTLFFLPGPLRGFDQLAEGSRTGGPSVATLHYQQRLPQVRIPFNIFNH